MRGERATVVLRRRRFRALALDMDGTLTGADGRVSERTVRVLARAERAGLRVVIATGRTAPTPLAVWHAAQLSAPIITCGGSMTLQPPALEVLDVRELPEHVVTAALTLGARHRLAVSLWTPDTIWMTELGPIADLLARINDQPIELLGNAATRPKPVVKVMLGGAPGDVDGAEAAVLAGLRDSSAARSMLQFIEATPAGASKERALGAVLERLEVAPCDVIAAGDANNDLPMLALAGLAIAPADAMPDARAAADLVVGPHDRDGVAEFLEWVLDEMSTAPSRGAA